ncbi:hypothetical protein B7463_g4725, partial [Scytalidium lignicola]
MPEKGPRPEPCWPPHTVQYWYPPDNTATAEIILPTPLPTPTPTQPYQTARCWVGCSVKWWWRRQWEVAGSSYRIIPFLPPLPSPYCTSSTPAPSWDAMSKATNATLRCKRAAGGGDNASILPAPVEFFCFFLGQHMANNLAASGGEGACSTALKFVGQELPRLGYCLRS